MPPRPGGVAIATMVSEVENTISQLSTSSALRELRLNPTTTVESVIAAAYSHFRNEIRTVFENASPTLSVVTPDISATAMCTSRRSYGLSGPSC